MHTANWHDRMGQATPPATGLPLMLSSQASYVIVSGFRAALDLDTYPLSNFIRPRCAERAKRCRDKPVLIMHIGFFSLFSRHISRTQSFQQNRQFTFRALVALKMLVSLISRLVACSPRIVRRRTDKQTDRQTHTQNDYCNPRCACAPRVNNYTYMGMYIFHPWTRPCTRMHRHHVLSDLSVQLKYSNGMRYVRETWTNTDEITMLVHHPDRISTGVESEPMPVALRSSFDAMLLLT